MKEKRVYIVSMTNQDGEPYDLDFWEIYNMNDEDFMDEAEAQGNVWSLEGFVSSWNIQPEVIPHKEISVMRIIEVEF